MQIGLEGQLADFSPSGGSFDRHPCMTKTMTIIIRMNLP